MQKTINVVDVISVKRGVGSRGTWELWNVIDDQGVKYSTFKDDYQQTKGRTITIDVEKKGNFWNIVEPRSYPKNQAQATGQTASQAQLLEKLFVKMTALDEKIDRILDIVGSLDFVEPDPDNRRPI